MELISKESYMYKETGGNDECYTPIEGVLPILKYIPQGKVVWCPFDTEESIFVKEISKTNKVIKSHIKEGKDFFEYEPEEHWDMIISNPPFTKKKEYFQRVMSFNKPFALIMSIVWLNDKAPKDIFFDKQLQLLMFDKRMRFINPEGEKMGNPSFSSAYFCYDFLPQDLIIERL